MNTQMIICMVIFAATLVSYMLNKIPMWLTAMISLAALYFTGCTIATVARSSDAYDMYQRQVNMCLIS